MNGVKKKYGYLAGIISVIANVIISLIKITFGLMTNSVALIADGAHSFTDLLSSIVVIIGVKTASKPADKTHPFGHGRIEQIASLAISIFMFMIAFEFAKTSIERIMFGSELKGNPFLLIGVISITLVIKIIVIISTWIFYKKSNSGLIKVDMVHHLSDFISTIFVVFIFIFQALNIDLNIDGYVGIIVSLFIAYTGFEMAKQVISPLIGEKPSDEYLQKIRDIVKAIPGIFSVHDISVHSYGDFKVVSIHVEIPNNISFEEAHNITDEVEIILNEKLQVRAVAHADPVYMDDENLNDIKKYMDEIIGDIPEIKSYHDARIVYNYDDINLFLDILLDDNIAYSDGRKARSVFSGRIKEKFSDIKEIGIHIEPLFNY